MTNIKKLILSVELTERDIERFVFVCGQWDVYCSKLQSYNKLKVMKLIKYLITQRKSGNLLLGRAIGRFNRLNALKGSDLK